MWRRSGGKATLDDVVEYLHGIGRALMSIDATLKEIHEILEEVDDGDA